VRDNIHISLLAKVYAHFVAELPNGISRMGPSGYIESQGSFTHRIANEMRKRLGLRCEFVLKQQTEFSEPRIRINTDVADTGTLDWSEMAAWDEVANYYTELLTK
jgi:UDP-glucose 4-epimerase